MIKITILVENTAGNKCRAEHGLSYLIEADKTVLFDTGASDLFIQNARLLSVDMSTIDAVVLSHGHDDHSGGIRFLESKKLICHPGVFTKRFRKVDGTGLGFPIDRAEAEKRFEVTTSSEAFRISQQIWFLGEVPRLNDFEAKDTSFLFEDNTEDFTLDDTGLAVIGDDGLIVISGCAHSGICNMVDHAIKVTGIEKVKAVIGGFHLKKNDKITKRTIEHLKKLQVQQVIPSHCTMFPALAAFLEKWKFAQLKTGNILQF